VLPSVLEYIKRKNENPKYLLFSLAALIAFYKGERGEERFTVKDDQSALDFFATQWATGDSASVAKATLKNTDFWGTDLTQFEGLEEIVANNLESIITNGMKATLDAFVK
jgi:tagaturonate reductase